MKNKHLLFLVFMIMLSACYDYQREIVRSSQNNRCVICVDFDDLSRNTEDYEGQTLYVLGRVAHKFSVWKNLVNIIDVPLVPGMQYQTRIGLIQVNISETVSVSDTTTTRTDWNFGRLDVIQTGVRLPPTRFISLHSTKDDYTSLQVGGIYLFRIEVVNSDAKLLDFQLAIRN